MIQYLILSLLQDAEKEVEEAHHHHKRINQEVLEAEEDPKDLMTLEEVQETNLL